MVTTSIHQGSGGCSLVDLASVEEDESKGPSAMRFEADRRPVSSCIVKKERREAKTHKSCWKATKYAKTFQKNCKSKSQKEKGRGKQKKVSGSRTPGSCDLRSRGGGSPADVRFKEVQWQHRLLRSAFRGSVPLLSA